jgi:hypothetical protein
MSPHMPDRGSVLTPAAGSLDHEMRWPRTRLGYCWRMDFDASTLRDRRLERPVRGGGFLPNPRISYHRSSSSKSAQRQFAEFAVGLM